MPKTDREATQSHTVLNCLTKHTGKLLSGDLVEQIWKEMIIEMWTGSCSWAFRESDAVNVAGTQVIDQRGAKISVGQVNK